MMDKSGRRYRPVMHHCDHDKEVSSPIKFNNRDCLGSCWFVATPPAIIFFYLKICFK